LRADPWPCVQEYYDFLHTTKGMHMSCYCIVAVTGLCTMPGTIPSVLTADGSCIGSRLSARKGQPYPKGDPHQLQGAAGA